jgi:hypothetical protein
LKYSKKPNIFKFSLLISSRTIGRKKQRQNRQGKRKNKEISFLQISEIKMKKRFPLILIYIRAGWPSCFVPQKEEEIISAILKVRNRIHAFF